MRAGNEGNSIRAYCTKMILKDVCAAVRRMQKMNSICLMFVHYFNYNQSILFLGLFLLERQAIEIKNKS